MSKRDGWTHGGKILTICNSSCELYNSPYVYENFITGILKQRFYVFNKGLQGLTTRSDS